MPPCMHAYILLSTVVVLQGAFPSLLGSVSVLGCNCRCLMPICTSMSIAMAFEMSRPRTRSRVQVMSYMTGVPWKHCHLGVATCTLSSLPHLDQHTYIAMYIYIYSWYVHSYFTCDSQPYLPPCIYPYTNAWFCAGSCADIHLTHIAHIHICRQICTCTCTCTKEHTSACTQICMHVCT